MTFSPAKTTVAASYLSASSRRSEDVKMLRVALFTERGWCQLRIFLGLLIDLYCLFYSSILEIASSSLPPHHIYRSQLPYYTSITLSPKTDHTITREK